MVECYHSWFVYVCFFFFSSRRRHTRLQGDWSSDVCSSDLRRILSVKRGRGECEDRGRVSAGGRPAEVRVWRRVRWWRRRWRGRSEGHVHTRGERERGVEGKRGDLRGRRII